MKSKLAAVTFAVLTTVMFAPTASASVSFSWGLSVEDHDQQIYNYAQATDPFSSLSTDGLQQLQAGNTSASLQGWVDPVTGVFKSKTAVSVDGLTPTNIAEAHIRLDLNDTLRFSGAGDMVEVDFLMSYDTFFSGLGLEPFERYAQISHFMQAWSSRSILLNWQVANPDYDPSLECYSEGEIYDCPKNSEPFFNYYTGDGLELYREWALGGPDGVYSNGEATNGLHTGTLKFTATLPVDIDISIDYFAYNNSRCFHLQTCDVATNALFSDYIGIEVKNGTFQSANGYQYLGLAGANNPSPVSAPTGLALFLSGFAALLWRRRKA